MAARHGPGNGFVEPRRIGADLGLEVGIERDPFGHHFAQRASAVVLEVPFLGHDLAQQRLEPCAIIDDLLEQVAQVPLIEHPPDIEHDRLDLHHLTPNANGPNSLKEPGRSARQPPLAG